jgi:hypothetical protein
MNLVLDSSALAKLYLEEPESEDVVEAIQQAKQVSVSALALPEVAASLARRHRDGEIKENQLQQALSQLHTDWEDLERIAVDDQVAQEAGILARSRAIRGADAVHLATVALLSRERKGVRLVVFDAELLAAAKAVVKVWEA